MTRFYIDRISKLEKDYLRVFSFSSFNDRTNGLFFESKERF